MDTVLIDGINYNLNSLEADIWQKLSAGCSSYKNPLHNVAVANVNEHGVNMRTVVLRKVWVNDKKLAFHTDIRSGKWSELEQQNNISWLFYDAASRLQIRLSGRAILHQNDSIANDAWEASSMSSRKIYMGEDGPSTISPIPVSGLPAAFESNDPTPQESEIGRKNFGIVVADIVWMEWVWLNSKGHRRAGFNYAADKSFTANWLVP